MPASTSSPVPKTAMTTPPRGRCMDGVVDWSHGVAGLGPQTGTVAQITISVTRKVYVLLTVSKLPLPG